MLASVPVDLEVHDTYFVVAHFHYVLIGGAVFPMFAALYYWLPKITGRMLNTTIGQVNFWLFFIGFNMTFFTMHFIGLHGLPRRVYTYSPDLHVARENFVATIGAYLMGLGVLAFIVNFFYSQRFGEIAGPSPWGAGSLEWATSSPPPSYNFLELPTVNGREAIWDAAPNQPIVGGLRDDIREVLITNSLDGDPDHRQESPGPSAWPFWTAVTTSIFFVWSVFTPNAVWGLIPVTVCIIGWFWPKRSASLRRKAEEIWSES
jgi:cytochrome c oxidase subunit 1